MMNDNNDNNALNLFNAQAVADALIAQLELTGVNLTNDILDDKGAAMGIRTIDPNATELISLCILDTIANVISTLIDAGSERDAVNENEELLIAINEELNGWTR